MSQRVYHDPLHGAIRLDRQDPLEGALIELIDSGPFQRLRRIRQLGTAFLTFHGAESSRFTHSLGVMELARRAYGALGRHRAVLEPHRPVLLAAALLHDLGHAPLSHSGEEMFGLRHEVWSGRLVREHPAIKEPLERLGAGTADRVASLLEGGTAECSAVKALVSSQLDCDRLDYLLRDSHSTGASYGHLDLERILAALTLAPDGSLAVHPKGLIAVEHYLVVRNLMYRSIYNHRLNSICSWLLVRLIAAARELGPARIFADGVMARWLWEPQQLSLADYLANDDLRCGYHLLRWSEEAPEPLGQLSGRLLQRRLLKALNVSGASRERRLELLAAARRLSSAAGLDPETCCGLQQRQSHGYDPYRGGLRLWDGVRLEALEARSALVRSLIEPVEVAWLIHPQEVSAALGREAGSMEASDPPPGPPL